MKKHCLNFDSRKFLCGESKCKAGVDIRANLGGNTFGSFNRIPCISTNEAEFSCPFSKFRTDAEQVEHEEKRQKNIAEFVESLKVMAPLISRLKRENKGGGHGVESCPKCSGELRWQVSACNGHIAMNCQTPDCYSMME